MIIFRTIFIVIIIVCETKRLNKMENNQFEQNKQKHSRNIKCKRTCFAYDEKRKKASESEEFSV